MREVFSIVVSGRVPLPIPDDEAGAALIGSSLEVSCRCSLWSVLYLSRSLQNEAPLPNGAKNTGRAYQTVMPAVVNLFTHCLRLAFIYRLYLYANS